MDQSIILITLQYLEDRASWGEVEVALRPEIRRCLASRIRGLPQDRLDGLVSDSLSEVWKSFESQRSQLNASFKDSQANFAYWLNGVLRHVAAHFFAQQKHRECEVPLAASEIATPEPSPFEYSANRERRIQLFSFILQMPARMRYVLILHLLSF